MQNVCSLDRSRRADVAGGMLARTQVKQRSDRGRSTALSRWDDRGHGSAQSVQVKAQLAVWPNTRTKRVGAIAGGLGLGAPPLRHAQWGR